MPGHLQSSSDSRSSDDYQAVSKFVQAMKDPNWRRRDGGEYKSDSNIPSDVHHEAPLDANHGPSARSSEDSIEHQSPDDPDLEQLEQFLGHPILRNIQHIASPATKPKPLDDPDMTTPIGLCGVAMNRAIEGAGVPTPLSLIHLIPLYNAQHQFLEESNCGAHFDVVKVQRLRKTVDEPQVKLNDDLDAQLVAALQTATQTPTKIKPQSKVSTPLISTGSDVKHLKSAETVLRDPAITETGPLSRTPVVNKDPARIGKMASTCGSTVPHGDSQQPVCTSSNVAFQKMLQKLHRRTDRSSTREARSSQADSVHHSDSPLHGTELRTRIKKKDLRNTDSSDASCGSGPSNMTWSTKATSISSSFNPKAREFLSFSKKEPEVPEEFQHQRFRRLPLADLFRKPDDGQPAHVSTSTDSEGQPSLEPHSCPQPINTLPSPATDVWPDFLSHLVQTGSSPLSMYPPLGILPNPFSTWSPGQLPSMLMPVAMPPIGPPPGMGTSLPTAPRFIPHGLYSVPPISQVPSCYSAPDAGNSGLSMPPQPQQAGFSTLPRRCYVPKPRKPDPRDQLAYEAWIEWRKANEPGYAMECKLRQKRRAQRMTANRSKPDTTETDTSALTSEPLPDME